MNDFERSRPLIEGFDQSMAGGKVVKRTDLYGHCYFSPSLPKGNFFVSPLKRSKGFRSLARLIPSKVI